MDIVEMTKEMGRLSLNIDKGVEELRTQTAAFAEAEREYRKAKAIAWAEMLAVERPGVTAAHKEAQVNADTADLRFVRDLAEGSRKAALEAVRARQSQLSALMTLLAAHRAEAHLAQVDQRGNA